MPASEHAHIRDGLAAIMREAGKLACDTARRPMKRWNKNGSSPVSEGDIAVNDLLRERLSRLLPDAGWLSEESDEDLARLQAPSIWVVDPIDGTRAYIADLPDWSISVALVENGRPAVAAVFAPVDDEMFLAASGEGATRNGARISASGGEALSGARIAGPRSYLKRLADLDPQILGQPKVHSLALRFARVAEGRLDACFASRRSRDWDLAAADLLVHEAGGAMTDFLGQSLSYNCANPVHGALLAAGQARHETLIDLVRDREDEFA